MDGEVVEVVSEEVGVVEEKKEEIAPVSDDPKSDVQVPAERTGSVSADDPYSYLDQNGFTSEKFKIEIRNLPRYYGFHEMKKLLNNKLKLSVNKLKTPGKYNNWAYVCFRSEEDRVKAIQVLNGYNWKGNVLKAENAKAVPDPLVKRRLEDSAAEKNKKLKVVTGTIDEQIQDVATPLWRMSYEEQLQKKETEMREVLTCLAVDLVRINPNLKDWVNSQREKYEGLPCELWPIRHAPVPQDGYRNKCEFSAGLNEATGDKTVGFRLGSYATGSVGVAPMECIMSVPGRMKQVVLLFQTFIRSSNLDVFNTITHQGYWRQLTVRYSFRTDQLMMIVGLHPQKLTPQELEAVGKDVTAFFMEGGGKEGRVTSLFIQHIEKRKSDKEIPSLVHLAGEKYLQDELLSRTFQVSPLAFFQTNTAGADVLYESIGELAGLTKDTSLLDVCCGTGSIGICLADKCGEVLGLEVSDAAVTDARENAKVNNVTTATFFTGKAEEILSAVVQQAKCQQVVAVVDPPRAGLNVNAMVQIRKTKNLHKLVYVSCDPKVAAKNLLDLARPCSKVYHRQPFVPIKAVPVDMFPFTNHCELIIYFERLPDPSEP